MTTKKVNPCNAGGNVVLTEMFRSVVIFYRTLCTESFFLELFKIASQSINRRGFEKDRKQERGLRRGRCRSPRLLSHARTLTKIAHTKKRFMNKLPLSENKMICHLP